MSDRECVGGEIRVAFCESAALSSAAEEWISRSSLEEELLSSSSNRSQDGHAFMAFMPC